MGSARAAILGLAMIVTACSQDAPLLAESPAEATGETPVQYVVCNLGGRECFVAARFDDFRSCEWHKELSSMLCDDEADPGVVTCRRASAQIASGFCTK